MANDNSNTLTTGVLLLAGGAAGYAAARWVVAPWLEGKAAAPSLAPVPFTPTSSPPIAAPATAPPSSPPTPPSSPPTQLTAPPVHTTPPPATSMPGRGPITSPSQVDNRPAAPRVDTPTRSPSSSKPGDRPSASQAQVDTGRAPRVDARPSRVDDARPPARVGGASSPPHVEPTHPTRVDKPAAQPTDAKRAPAPIRGPVTTPSHIDPQRGPVTSPSQVENRRPPTQADGPVTSPSQVDARRTPPRVDGPVTSPSQVDARRTPARVDGPVTSPSQVDQRRTPSRIDGPVTSPSQLDGARVTPHDGPPASAHPINPYGPPASAHPIDPYGPPAGAKPIDPYADRKPSSGLPRRFDAVLERYRGEIPIEYLRALVDRESNFEPKQRTGSAIGLMQIIPVVLADYNTRNGTHYKPEHLVDPSINVAIGCELLVIIIAGYAGNHPRVANLQADWRNPRFVELLTFGWNAGFSEAGGVGRVARYLERHGVTDLTIDLVSQSASAAGASKHLSNAAKVRWCKSVAALYGRERTLTASRRINPHA